MNRTERKYYFMQTFLSIKLQKGHRHGLAHARIGDFQHLKLPKVFFLLAIATNIVGPWSAVKEFEADLTNIRLHKTAHTLK